MDWDLHLDPTHSYQSEKKRFDLTEEKVPLVATYVINECRMNRSLDLGPMNIWCEFEEVLMKTLLCNVHIRKHKVAPLPSGHKCHLLLETMYWGLDHGPMNIW